MNIKKGFLRSIAYIKRFYGVASIPLQFLTYTSIIYDKIISEIPTLLRLVPEYRSFLGWSFLLVFVFIYVGYLYTKKSRFVIEEIEIGIEINPYMKNKIPVVHIPVYKAYIQLFEKNGINVDDMRKILANSIEGDVMI